MFAQDVKIPKERVAVLIGTKGVTKKHLQQATKTTLKVSKEGDVTISGEDSIDVFVTTGANITHDLIEALGDKHYQGESNVDDSELNKQGIDRIYNVFMKNEVYEIIISIDSVTAETYHRVRGADFSLLLQNVRKLNNAKKVSKKGGLLPWWGPRL